MSITKNFKESITQFRDNFESLRLQDKLEQQLRIQLDYKSIVDYSVKQGDLYHLLDCWYLLQEIRDQADRGFFLDLWDMYPGSEVDELILLRDFVCQSVRPEFRDILDIVQDPKNGVFWQQQVQQFLLELILSNKQEEVASQRKLLYAIAHLYTKLYNIYPNERQSYVIPQEKESLVSQLKAAKDAGQCRVSPGKPLINLADTFQSNSTSELQLNFSQIFLYLYRFVDHETNIPLDKFVKNVIDSLKGADDKVEQSSDVLKQLLKYWASTTPFMKIFIKEKFNYEFYQYAPPSEVQLPSFYGTDNYIGIIGEPRASKTKFLYALEAASQLVQDPDLQLSVKLTDDTDDLDKVKANRKRWQQSEEEELFTTEDISLCAQTSVHQLCRLVFYSLPGDVLDIGGTISPLDLYLTNHQLYSIILIFDPNQVDLKYYISIVDKLEKYLSKSLKYIPIYFVINNSEKVLEAIKDSEENEELVNQFKQYLKCELEDFKLFSSQCESEISDYYHLLDILYNSETYCQNLAFLNHLAQDVNRLGEIVNRFLEAGFSNLSFAYTSSLCYSESDKYHYTDLIKLWTNISRFIMAATKQECRSYYKEYFNTKLLRDLVLVENFSEGASFDELTEFNLIQLDEITNLNPNKNKPSDSIFRNSNLRLEDWLHNDPILQQINEESKTLQENTKRVSDELEKCLKTILLELGIPVNLWLWQDANSALEGELKGYEQLPGEMQKLLSKRKECPNEGNRIIFHEKYGVLNTLCLYHDEPLEETQKDFIFSERVNMTVFQRFCQLTSEDNVKLFCKILKNYDPRYSQFSLNFLVQDTVKVKVIEKLGKHLDDLDEILVNLLITLWINYRQVNNTLKDNTIEVFYRIRYILNILSFKHFKVDEFKKNPEEIIENIDRLIQVLEKALTDSKEGSLDESKWKEFMNKFYEPYRAVISITKRLPINTVENLNQQGQELQTELKVCRQLYSYICQIIPNEIDSVNNFFKSPEKLEFVFSNKQEYKKQLDDYQRERKRLLLRERSEYLQESKWLEELEPDQKKVVRYLHDFDNKPDNLFLKSLDQLKDDFIKEIEIITRKFD